MSTGYFHLNLDNDWPAFLKLNGLVKGADGTLSLARVPQAETTLVQLPPTEGPPGPAGIGVDSDGNLYIADPGGHRIVRWDSCSGQLQPLPCFGGEGSAPGQLQGPRGVLVGPRSALYVADSGNHRVQVVDLPTLQLRGIWGQPDPYTEPQPGTAPGRLHDPWDLAVDQAGHVYVVDHGNRRVQQFDANGRVITAFWQMIQAQYIVPQEPTYITTASIDGVECLCILDPAQQRVLVYGTDGTLNTAATDRWKELALGAPAGVAFTNDTLYVGDTTPGHTGVFAFNLQGHGIGVAHGYKGPVAGLHLDEHRRLLVHSGRGGAVTRLLPGQAFVETGTFMAGPFTVGDQPTHWHRLRVWADPLPENAHMQLYTHTSYKSTPPPKPGEQLVARSDTMLTPTETWRAAPLDALDLLVLHEPAQYLWIAGELRGHGTSSPTLHQMRLEYDHETWLRYLPAIYGRDEAQRPFLEQSLSLFESLLTEVDSAIDDLPQRFDPGAAPDVFPQSWLKWLAGWLAFELDETWGPEQRREALRRAFELLGRRGTVAGLQRFIALYAGATAYIAEPARYANLWSLSGSVSDLWPLSETSVLGFTTMLAPAAAQGAVVGTTAVVNASHLIGDEDYGAPLFEDVAHHFCVQVYAAEMAGPATVDTVRRVVEREKPAHTTYHVCVIEPGMRVGFQARLGIDTIVGALPDLTLGAPQQLGVDMQLGQSPDRPAGSSMIGQDAKVGQHATLA